MKKYICKMHSTAGTKGSVISLEDGERVRQLMASGIIAEYVEAAGEKPRRGRKKKSDLQYANPLDEVEYK